MNEKIQVFGARVNNLKNIDVEIPRNTLTVITGLSGSGKSSLAFNTLFAEGQRRYIDTLSPYARNFMGSLERPDVDKITGLSPVISIEQKTTNKNPRSTVGTITEIYDYLRLLFARTADAYSYLSGEKMVKYTEEKIYEMVLNEYAGKRIYILAPLVRQRKGHYRELFESMRKKGYLNIRVDGEMREITRGMKVDRYINHNIEVVIDKLKVEETPVPIPSKYPLPSGGGQGVGVSSRLQRSLQMAFRQGDGMLMIIDMEDNSVRNFSRRLMDPVTGIAYQDPAPNLFSFNSPEGACPRCKGLGTVNQIDIAKIIPDNNKSIHEGAIAPLGKYKNQMIFWQIEALLNKYDCNINTTISQIPEDALNEILYGSLEHIKIAKELVHTSSDYFITFEGIIKYIHNIIERDDSPAAQKWADQFLANTICPECHGKRLKREALAFRIEDKNIAQVADLDIRQLKDWCQQIVSSSSPSGGGQEGTGSLETVRATICKQILTRVNFLLQVGLDYLALSRPAASLSGGETQRIRLATQIGSQLVNVLYILDEPSIGLHQRDNQRLINSLKALRDADNTVIVVEHDRDIMLAADYLIDLGPAAGVNGGEILYQGPPTKLIQSPSLREGLGVGVPSLTAEYLAQRRQIPIPDKRRKGNGHFLTITGAKGNNLKNIQAKFPLGTLTVITGVSGSGKSTLVNDTLQPILSQHFYHSLKKPLPYDNITGIQHIDKVIAVDQNPIGKTPRSNPATYTGAFTDIRNLFGNLPEAKIRGYKPGRFSFNVKGGRCEACSGNGYKNIEMNFLPDVIVPCEICHGKRYNHETLQVRYKGKSIADILDMTINQAVQFFQTVPHILQKIKTLQQVGLGYLKLGQPSSTLSGGENQRVKLAAELEKKDTTQTLYILDEPTTGLHFEDIRILMQLLQQLVDKGNTVIVIEHNIDVILQADHIIDLGPEGGQRGGQIICQGTPEQIAKNKKSYTAKFIRDALKTNKKSL